MFLKTISLLLLDTAMILSADMLAIFIRFRTFSEISQLYEIWPFIVLIRLFYLYGKGFYKKKFSSLTEIWLKTISNVTVSSMFIVAVTFFNRNFSFSRLVFVYSWFATILLISLERSVIYLVAASRVRTKRVVLIGDNASVSRVAAEIGQRSVRSWLMTGIIPVSRMACGVPLLMTVSRFLGSRQKLKAFDLAILAMDGMSEVMKLRVLSHVKQHGYEYLIIPSFYELITSRAETEGLSRLSLLEPVEQPLKIEERFFKRVFDLGFSLLAVVGLSPAYILVGLAILLTSGFPIIYKQKRIGRNGVPFNIYKFRTMVKNADRIGPVLTERNDRRIFPLGRFLRKTSLDEIPQFINVLKGDMSVTGPRPEVPEIVKKYNTWQKEVLKVRPGITGLAQISGRQDLELGVKLKMDIYYIENYSLALDIRIILRTMLIPFNSRGAR